MSNEWRSVPAASVARIEIGGTPAREQPAFWADQDSGYAWASIADLNTEVVIETAEYISELGVRSSNVKFVPAGTPIMSFKLTIGRTSLSGCDLYTNEAIAAFFPDPSQLDRRYLLHTLPGAARSVITDVAIKGATLNKKSLSSMRLPLPPIEDQRCIAEILDTLDDQIAAVRQIDKKLTAIRQGLLYDLMTRGVLASGQLRPCDTDAASLYVAGPCGLRPRDWRVGLLDRFARRGSGHTPNKGISSYWNGGIKWVSLADSSKLDKFLIVDTDKKISEAGIANSSAVLHPAGTVILSRDAGVGKSAILAERMAVSQHFMAWQVGDQLDNVYLYYWLQFMKRSFEAIALGSTIQTIGLSHFRKLKIAVPSLEEQERVVLQMRQAELAIDCVREELTALKLLKQGLSVDLLAGRTRVLAKALS